MIANNIGKFYHSALRIDHILLTGYKSYIFYDINGYTLKNLDHETCLFIHEYVITTNEKQLPNFTESTSKSLLRSLITIG